MTYDPVDANDDGIVESDVDNESVNTGDVDIDLDSDGTLLEWIVPNGNHTDVTQITRKVSTDAVKILDAKNINGSDQDSGLLFVSGVNDVSERFADILLIGPSSEQTIIASTNVVTSVSRSYSSDSRPRPVLLAMGSGTWDVRVRYINLGGFDFA